MKIWRFPTHEEEREKNNCVLLYQLPMCGSHDFHNITIVAFRTVN